MISLPLPIASATFVPPIAWPKQLRSKIRSAVERGERDPTYMELPSFKHILPFVCFYDLTSRNKLTLHKSHGLLGVPVYQPRLDELDENIVYYWCNVRTRGNLKNRHAQGLHVSTTAQGNTDRFKSQLMSNKFDLASMGHHGPAKKEQKAVKASYPTTNIFICSSASKSVPEFSIAASKFQATIRTSALHLPPILFVTISIQSSTAKKLGLYFW